MQYLVKLFLICFLITCSTAYAINEHEFETKVTSKSFRNPGMNGKAWKMFDKQAKINYLSGIEDGFSLFWMQLDDDNLFQMPDTRNMIKETVVKLTISGFRMGDLVEQVDMIYSDSANIRIPVIESYRHVLKELRGSEQAALAKDISMLRKKYNN